MRGPNLEPTVPGGSTLLVQTRWRVIRRGDIVVFKAPAVNLPYLWVLRTRFVPDDMLPESCNGTTDRHRSQKTLLASVRHRRLTFDRLE